MCNKLIITLVFKKKKKKEKKKEGKNENKQKLSLFQAAKRYYFIHLFHIAMR